MTGLRMSVVVPAHNEERVIGRLLTELSAHSHELELVVVANGCTDDTADAARSAAPDAIVLEIDTASKIAALNAGDAAASVLPRAYVDADARITGPALLALADLLGTTAAPLTAAPRMVVDTAGASWASRAYHAVWTCTPYVRRGPIGCGVYGLNAAARAQFGKFPDVVGDDLWIERMAGEDRTVLEGHEFVYTAPRTARALVGRLTRSTTGNLQLQRDHAMAASTGAPPGLVRSVSRQPRLWPAFTVYLGVRLLVELRARRRLAAGDLRWTRDETSRQTMG
ncbi:glycosyltransferase [Nocardioides pacificus]